MFPFESTAGRLAATAAAVFVCVALLLVFEPVRLAAEDFLGVFRVERFAAVTIDPNNPPAAPHPSELGTFTQPAPPKMHEVSLGEAQSLVQFKLIDLPASVGLPANSPFVVSEGVQLSFTFDAEKVKAYLASQGISHLVLPKNLDGATIRVNIPPIVSKQGYFPDGASRANQRHLSFIQTTSPTMEVPPDCDVELIRAQLLSSGLLPPDLARQLAAIQDWRKTAVIPVPADATRRDVDVAGAPGLLIAGPQYGATVFWQRNGVVYGLTGNLPEEELLSLARSIK